MLYLICVVFLISNCISAFDCVAANLLYGSNGNSKIFMTSSKYEKDPHADYNCELFDTKKKKSQVKLADVVYVPFVDLVDVIEAAFSDGIPKRRNVETSIEAR